MDSLPKHASPDQMQRDLDIMLSKINAMEVVAQDEFQRSVVKVLRELVQGQAHSLNEFGHLKKAIDMVTLELFKVKSAQS